ncbi:MAG: DUF1059 domain-containing protein [Actinomycetota bacterium]|nr:DUF1059 domain-containing protein [Actinomycetota bacterium]
MAKKLSFQCSHGGVVCGARVTGDTEDEVVTKAVEHARNAHGVDLTQAQTLARYARSLVREEEER